MDNFVYFRLMSDKIDDPYFQGTRAFSTNRKYIAKHRKQLLTAKNNAGDTPLLVAAKNNDDASVHALLATIDNYFYYCRGLMFHSINLIPFLKEYVKQINNEGNTVLSYELMYGHLKTAKMLLKKGAEFVINKNGDTALHLAVQNDNPELITWLLKKGLTLEAKNINGDTALMLAATKGNLEVVKVLINAGASLSERNAAQKPAYDLALEANQTHVTDWLNQKKVGLSMQSLGNLSIFSGAQSNSVSILDQVASSDSNQHVNNTVLDLTQNLIQQMNLN